MSTVIKMLRKNESFNRYMVECECFIADIPFIFLTGFNRYMVECELVRMCAYVCLATGFNRYMVECELKKHLTPRKRYSF